MSSGLVAPLAIALSFFITSFLFGCGKSEEPVASTKPKPFLALDPMEVALDTPELIQGRDVWVPTCGQCHVKGLGGAPKIGDIEAWAPRIAKGKEVLYDHAINGFSGPLLLEMPPKGGFMDLTDEEVKRAVDFVVFASQSKDNEQ